MMTGLATSIAASLLLFPKGTSALIVPLSSVFYGASLQQQPRNNDFVRRRKQLETLTMRKQKASDKRTRRLQRGEFHESLASSASSMSSRASNSYSPIATLTTSPMDTSAWRHKAVDITRASTRDAGGNVGSRGRARKRAEVYASISSYHNEFLDLLTQEYRAEEAEVLGRLDASLDNPLALENDGHALFDLFPERRGNIFADEVYRLTKAKDATTTFPIQCADDEGDECLIASLHSQLPSNHKFSSNDVILLTLQPFGSGDFFGTSSIPNHPDAAFIEARVLETGPDYVDVAISGGVFEQTFGPAPNNAGPSGRGDPKMRLRADRFLSDVPYTRMVAALGKITAVPAKAKAASTPNQNKRRKQVSNNDVTQMDPLFRELILSTFGCTDPSSPRYREPSADISNLARRLAKAPLPNSTLLANQVLQFMQSNPAKQFKKFNAPQLTAIGAALTRRLTLIQGPPGTGKTTVAGGIAFGFVHQCRNMSPNARVLACAFSNVGADNLVAQMIKLGLKVVRVGRASSVSEDLWDFTLDAAIARDADAKAALEDAAKATSNLRQTDTNRNGKRHGNKENFTIERCRRDLATTAVRASLQACRVAATRALRNADVIVSTSIGAADSRLLAACGISTDKDEVDSGSSKSHRSHQDVAEKQGRGESAPDGLPALSLPFVIVDEACQSVEPANLIPVTATDSCRALVLLGDPCQLPPTVKTDFSGGASSSPLSLSLMARLSSTLPHPVIVTATADATECDMSYLNAKPTRQAVSLMEYRNSARRSSTSYRKKYSGSLLLSVQYRMHPSISAFPSAVFYDGLLTTPAFLGRLRPSPAVLHSILPTKDASLGVRFVDVGGRNNERRGKSDNTSQATASHEGNTSYSNLAEAVQILKILKEVFRECKTAADAPGSIGIVTPYTSQLALIKSTLEMDSEFQELAKFLPTTIEIKSVDAYQGRERDLIIFSAVRSNRSGKLGFLTDWRRMNVALTRAKSGLIIVGDLETLTSGDTHWEALGKWCEGIGCVKTDD